MTFAEVDQRYLELKQQFHNGELSAEEFDEVLRSLMIQDEQGRWWAKARESGQWHYYDAATQGWAPGAPAATVPPPPPAPQPMTETRGAPQANDPSAAQAYTPMAQPYGDPAFGASQPELSPGLKVVFYILSFLVPLVGIVLFFVYRSKSAPADRAAARLFLILGAVSFGLSCLCSALVPLLFIPFS